MSSTTTYTVFVNGTEGESRSKKAKGVEQAEIALANNADALVELRTAAGNVVWTSAEDQAPVEAAEVAATTSNRTAPFTRTEDPNFEIEAPEGYEAAYTRARIKAVVFRHLTEKGDYLVVQVDGAGEVVVEEAATNTTEARVITNRLADEHRVAVQKAKDEAKALKDAEKVAKAEAKAAALAEKEAEAAAAATEDEAPAEVEAELQDA